VAGDAGATVPHVRKHPTEESSTMSTRSVIAIRTETGLRGRYCHSDGYPTWVGAQLVSIVQQHGYAAAVKRLTQARHGWSGLDVNTMDGETLPLGYEDGGFIAVPGYGTAYTARQDQSGADEWIVDAHEPPSDAVWAYVLDPEGITVLRKEGTRKGTVWADRGRVRYDDPEAVEQMKDAEDGVADTF
jgi:hypothetical protein